MDACLNAPVETMIRMGDAARAKVLQQHDVDKEASKLIDLVSQSLRIS
jgi:hypothetical protein